MLNPNYGPGVSGPGAVGEVRFIKTDGGAHPPDMWARLTMEDVLSLVEIAPSGTSGTISALAIKEDLRGKLMALLTEHYRLTQNSERFAVVRKTLADKLEPSISGVCNDLFRLMATTPFADHFARADVRNHLQRVIGQHSANVIHIERRYHADKQGE